MQSSSKKNEILDFAQEIIQKRGYNGFSYADISRAVGIRKASIHHHFPSKEALAVTVVRRYRERFISYLAKIAAEGKNLRDKINKYAKLYEAVLQEDRLCLCGTLASDIETLPDVLKKEIQAFFVDNVEWLSKILSLHYSSFSKKRLSDVSWQIISSLQGAVIMAKMSEKPELLTSISKELSVQLENLK
jgi:TetR/AcrR family transcriptional regulator, transcriptional repressor for nem operon